MEGLEQEEEVSNSICPDDIFLELFPLPGYYKKPWNCCNSPTALYKETPESMQKLRCQKEVNRDSQQDTEGILNSTLCDYFSKKSPTI